MSWAFVALYGVAFALCRLPTLPAEVQAETTDVGGRPPRATPATPSPG